MNSSVSKLVRDFAPHLQQLSPGVKKSVTVLHSPGATVAGDFHCNSKQTKKQEQTRNEQHGSLLNDFVHMHSVKLGPIGHHLRRQ